MKSKLSTTDKIAALLNRGRSITAIQALEQFGTMRLAARILDLRDAGMNITTTDIKTPSGKYVAKYKLAKTA